MVPFTPPRRIRKESFPYKENSLFSIYENAQEAAVRFFDKVRFLNGFTGRSLRLLQNLQNTCPRFKRTIWAVTAPFRSHAAFPLRAFSTLRCIRASAGTPFRTHPATRSLPLSLLRASAVASSGFCCRFFGPPLAPWPLTIPSFRVHPGHLPPPLTLAPLRVSVGAFSPHRISPALAFDQRMMTALTNRIPERRLISSFSASR